MSLTNNLINKPQISSDGQHREYIVTQADLIAGGAFTTVDIILETFPAGAYLDESRIKHLVSVAGTSITAATARLYFGPSGGLTAVGSGALDVFQAPGTTDGTHSISSTTKIAGDVEDPNLLVMRVTTTGGNLSAVTAGKIEAVASLAQVGF